MSDEQEALIERAKAALVACNHGDTTDAIGVIHDLVREVRRLQDKLDG